MGGIPLGGLMQYAYVAKHGTHTVTTVSGTIETEGYKEAKDILEEKGLEVLNLYMASIFFSHIEGGLEGVRKRFAEKIIEGLNNISAWGLLVICVETDTPIGTFLDIYADKYDGIDSKFIEKTADVFNFTVDDGIGTFDMTDELQEELIAYADAEQCYVMTPSGIEEDEAKKIRATLFLIGTVMHALD